MDTLFQPLDIGLLKLKNRIVFAPTSSGMEARQFYHRIAAGGAGLIIMADLSIVPSMIKAPSLASLEWADYLREIIEECHQYGCKVSAQIFHPEYDIMAMTSLYQQKGGHTPDMVRKLLAESTEHYCDLLTEKQIQDIIGYFASAAKNAKDIGFDMIQIHGDRLIGSFTSSLFNHRTDEYKDHTRFPHQIINAVRASVLDMPIDYKLTIRLDEPRLGRGGILESEVSEFTTLLEQDGVDSFHVAIANHTNIKDTVPAFDHPDLKGEACFLSFARLVKRYTKKPVCTVGKIQNPHMAREILSQDIDLIGMSRQLIADPDWPNKVYSKHEADITYCIYCNKQCIHSLMRREPMGCVLHQTCSSQS